MFFSLNFQCRAKRGVFIGPHVDEKRAWESPIFGEAAQDPNTWKTSQVPASRSMQCGLCSRSKQNKAVDKKISFWKSSVIFIQGSSVSGFYGFYPILIKPARGLGVHQYLPKTQNPYYNPPKKNNNPTIPILFLAGKQYPL